jgi:hypothetical protein
MDAKSRFLAGPGDLAALGEKAAAEGDSVLDHLRMTRAVLTAHLASATEAGDARLAAFVAGHLRLVLESIGKITGEIAEMARSLTINNTSVAVLESPEFLKVEAALLRALGPFPDARAAVVQALRVLDTDNAPVAVPGRLETLPATVIENAR